MEANLGEILAILAGKYGAIVQILSTVGMLRLIFKPLMVAAESISAATPTKVDDEILNKVRLSPLYKAVNFWLDLFTSVKLPVLTKVVEKK